MNTFTYFNPFQVQDRFVKCIEIHKLDGTVETTITLEDWNDLLTDDWSNRVIVHEKQENPLELF